MKSIFTTLILFVAVGLSAQNITDVARWSTIEPIGTARTLGVGGAFGAMGGDFSVININPAGIATYRVSEFTFTPSLKTAKTNSYFNADESSNTLQKSTKLGLDNLGFVIARNPSKKWTSSNFAFGFSRIADLNRNYQVKGTTRGSITTYMAEQANGKTVEELDEFSAYPAYYTDAIFDLGGTNNYETDFAEPDALVNKGQIVNQSGGINELTFGWAGEYKKNMSFGISMGVPFASFEESKTYSETDPQDEISDFNSLDFFELLNTSGVGINFKAGFNYKIANRIRIAGAFHSPTWYKFTDDYSVQMDYSYNDGTINQSSHYDSEEGTFDYKISTPWKAIGSLGSTFKIGDIVGFVDGDIEYLDYTNANYNGTAYSSDPSELAYTNEVNSNILNQFGPAINYRLGTEFGYKNLRLRLGYAWDRTAFIADDFYNNRLSYGIGFREDKFFIDLGIRLSQYSDGYLPYVVLDRDLDPLVNINTNKTRAALTLGFKF